MILWRFLVPCKIIKKDYCNKIDGTWKKIFMYLSFPLSRRTFSCPSSSTLAMLMRSRRLPRCRCRSCQGMAAVPAGSAAAGAAMWRGPPAEEGEGSGRPRWPTTCLAWRRRWAAGGGGSPTEPLASTPCYGGGTRTAVAVGVSAAAFASATSAAAG